MRRTLDSLLGVEDALPELVAPEPIARQLARLAELKTSLEHETESLIYTCADLACGQPHRVTKLEAVIYRLSSLRLALYYAQCVRGNQPNRLLDYVVASNPTRLLTYHYVATTRKLLPPLEEIDDLGQWRGVVKAWKQVYG